MGARHSGYRVTSLPENSTPEKRPDWIASAEAELAAFKAESFEAKIGLGKGKFGLVFLCRHAITSKHVAIKYVPRQIIFDTKSADKMQQEISILSRIKHPFIVHCYGGFKSHAFIALVFEFSAGGELFTLVKKRGKLSEETAKFYFCEIALALQYLHETLQVVFRDLKPDNVLIDHGGHVKLCDFGFAAPLNQLSALTDGCGTAMYLAPEIALGPSNGTHGYPVDWWSLGCILWEMTVGEAPFGDTDNMSKFQIYNNINSRVLRYPFLMSGALKAVIKGLLIKDPSRRFKWLDVQNSSWCSEVPWSDFLSLRIVPPWIPKVGNKPNADNFISWDSLQVPSGNAPNEVRGYTDDITVSKMPLAGRTGPGLAPTNDRRRSSAASQPSSSKDPSQKIDAQTRVKRGSKGAAGGSAAHPSPNKIRGIAVDDPDGDDRNSSVGTLSAPSSKLPSPANAAFASSSAQSQSKLNRGQSSSHVQQQSRGGAGRGNLARHKTAPNAPSKPELVDTVSGSSGGPSASADSSPTSFDHKMSKAKSGIAKQPRAGAEMTW